MEIIFEKSDESVADVIPKTENKSDAVPVEISKGKPEGLVMEDDPELRNFIVSVLGNEYKIHVARDGIDEHLKTASLSLIIRDIMIPQMVLKYRSIFASKWSCSCS